MAPPTRPGAMGPRGSGRPGVFNFNSPPGLTALAQFPRLPVQSSFSLPLRPAPPMTRAATLPNSNLPRHNTRTYSFSGSATNPYSPLANSVTGIMNNQYSSGSLEGYGPRRGSSPAPFSPVTPQDSVLDAGEPQMVTGLGIGGGEFAIQQSHTHSHHPPQLGLPMPNNPSGGTGLLQLTGQALPHHLFDTNWYGLSGPDISDIAMSTSGKPAKARRQPRLRASCDHCYKTKVKCTRERPLCRQCVTRGSDCRYSPALQSSKSSKNSKRKASVDVGAQQSFHSSDSMAMLASENHPAYAYPGAGHEWSFGIPHSLGPDFPAEPSAPFMPDFCTCASAFLGQLVLFGFTRGDRLGDLNHEISSLRDCVKSCYMQDLCEYCRQDAIPGAAATKLGDLLWCVQDHYKAVAGLHMELRCSGDSSGMDSSPANLGWHTKSENEVHSWWKIDVDVIDNDIWNLNLLLARFQGLWAVAKGLDQHLDYLGNNLPALVSSAVADLELVKTTGRLGEHAIDVSTPGGHELPPFGDTPPGMELGWAHPLPGLDPHQPPNSHTF